MVRVMDGLRRGRCLDGESLDSQPGGLTHVYPCTKRWHQFVSFGNGGEVPFGTIHTTIPLHTIRRISETDRMQEAYMCFGVKGRGDLDEEDWLGERTEEEGESSGEKSKVHPAKKMHKSERSEEDEGEEEEIELDENGLPHLRYWQGEQLFATRCSNTGAIIEWVVVPFIEEDTIDQSEEDQGSATDRPKEGHDEEEEEL
jgi:hypothetical protein